MSFRLEDKYIVNNEDKIKILSFIDRSGFEQEFKNRDTIINKINEGKDIFNRNFYYKKN